MNLELENQLFLVTGATSGLGRAVAESLLKEGAKVIAVARGKEKLEAMKQSYKDRIETFVADITDEQAHIELLTLIGGRQIHGFLVNAGGPPATTVLDAGIGDWDTAYKTVLRWKVQLVQAIARLMLPFNYGRIVFIESASVKEPMQNLVLSNAFRVAVVGFMKTLSQELASKGITLNALAPGFHDTAALNRLINKKMEQTGKSADQAKADYVGGIPVGFLGSPDDFASLAAWLFSSRSRYITGQTLSVDGGLLKGIMG